ncbi:DUF397 domain-containing protein [Streptomyces sp. AK02-01A]|uniref:DUF397 domain-containing protein n=1 Tax=Streptomyces sp. AK02-01A TaxID=3028648 RepID=UPI0029A53AA6|nr:DUF397 domain-containing protein [Streptomyces sp. AK02-01A]MDX3851109.1 DUF397 domain-containing protein [Streptomyces sp. AK02-01A]
MSTTPDLSVVEWAKSTYSNGDGGGCVEWAPKAAAASGVVPVRDSKDPSGPALTFSADGWAAFVTAVNDAGFPAR